MHWVAIVIILHNKLLWKLCFKIVIRYFHRSAGCVGSFASFLDLEVSWLVGPWLNGQQLLRVSSPHGAHEGKWKPVRLLGFRLRTGTPPFLLHSFRWSKSWWKSKITTTLTLASLVGGAANSHGQGVDSGKENGLTSSAVYHSWSSCFPFRKMTSFHFFL